MSTTQISTQISTPTSTSGSERSACVETPIDLCRPAEVTHRLGLEESAVVALVNAGDLAAYRVGGAVRFRRRDVEALRARLAA